MLEHTLIISIQVYIGVISTTDVLDNIDDSTEEIGNVSCLQFTNKHNSCVTPNIKWYNVKKLTNAQLWFDICNIL